MAAKQLNVGIATISEHLAQHGHDVGLKPNTKITEEQFALLEKEFAASIAVKQEAAELTIGSVHSNIVIASEAKRKDDDDTDVFVPTPSADRKAQEENKSEKVRKDIEKEKISHVSLPGLKIVDKIDLDKPRKQGKKTDEPAEQVALKNEPTAVPQPISKPVEVEHPAAEQAATPEKVEQQPTVEKQDTPAQVVSEQVAPTATPVSEMPQQVEQQPSVEKTEDVLATTQPKTTPQTSEEKSSIKTTAPIQENKQKKTTPPIETTLPSPPEKRQLHVKKSSVVKEEQAALREKTRQLPPVVALAPPDDDVIEAKADRLKGLKVVGKIALPDPKKKGKHVSSSDEAKDKKAKRKRVKRERTNKSTLYDQDNAGKAAQPSEKSQSPSLNAAKKKKPKKEEVSQKEVEAAFKKTKAKLSVGNRDTKTQNKRQYRKEKRSANLAARERELMQEQEEATVLRLTEFIAANEFATMMDVSVNEVISKCLAMGMFVSINQRLDADTITIIADEFGYSVEFTSAEEEAKVVLDEEDADEDKEPRAPIVTIMGHVDHGKTSLLDYVRNARVAEGEAGGITQHIGAYSVHTKSGHRIVFLDTPGHEAFTAMRARGAKVTDVVIIVIAADDSIMPQTIEAINHAQVAGVPIVIAINKVDKANANPQKIKEELSNLNILVEEWGGKYQSYEISAKMGLGIEELLEGVILESELLELKANANKNAVGTVIEASLDKGRGYVTTILVQSGTLKVGDMMLAGPHYGRVKAMTDHRGQKMDVAGPSTPVQVLGLNGAPQAGDKFNVLDSEREVKEIAVKRQQILREQSMRATKRTTLKDIGKRIEIGNFQQLNIIIKGDVDGSVEALTDSLLRLSTEEIEINIIHKAVGAVSEGDILLASASDAIVIGFQVRPTASARRLAEKENIETRLYSVIYDAINDVKAAMEGMLAPDIEEIVVGNAEVRETFKISKVGVIAGCRVLDGYIKRNANIRVVRDGIVVYGGESGGEINALKRFKDDVSEVRQGFDCGISIRSYNDLRVGDVIEAFEQREVKRSLS